MLVSIRLLLATFLLSLVASLVAADFVPCYEVSLRTEDFFIETLTADRLGNFQGTVGAGHVEADFAYQGPADKGWTLKARSALAGTIYKVVFEVGSSQYVFPIGSGQVCSGLQFKSGGINIIPRDVKSVKWYYATPVASEALA